MQKIVVYSAREQDGIRSAARTAAAVRDEVCRHVRPGMTTLALDRLAAEIIAASGAESAFFRYRGYPGQVCISVNDEVVHGIGRADRVIGFGDLVSLDIGVRRRGFIGDTAVTVVQPAPPTPAAAALLAATRESLQAGIAAAVAGNYINDISTAIETVIRRAGFSVVRDFVGHGCGRRLHEPPEVPNFAQPQRGARLRPGMVLAIEPMVNAGSYRVSVGSDGWTVRTVDGSLSAHFEHMVLITDGKPEILTWPETA